jgi:hypothetical protein
MAVAKQVLALLFGASVALGGESKDGEKFDSNGDSEGSNEGFGNSLYQEGGNPVVVFYNDEDTSGKVYCLEFIEVFETEALWADLDSPDSVEVDGTKFEFDKMDLVYVQNNDPADTTWDYQIMASAMGAQFGNLTFTFRGQESTVEEGTFYGLKFDIEVDSYTWNEEEGDADQHKFVVEFKIEDCTEEHSSEKDDADDSDESADGEEEEEEAETRRLQEEESSESASEDSEDSSSTVEGARRLQEEESPESESGEDGESSSSSDVDPARRLLGEDDEEEEDAEEEGDSEDSESSDSNEFDFETAVFTVNPYAVDCADENVNVTLVVGGNNDKLYVVFDKFVDCVKLDPSVFTLAGLATGAAAPVFAWTAVLSAALATALFH